MLGLSNSVWWVVAAALPWAILCGVVAPQVWALWHDWRGHGYRDRRRRPRTHTQGRT
jgi:hypothetical protein